MSAEFDPIALIFSRLGQGSKATFGDVAFELSDSKAARPQFTGQFSDVGVPAVAVANIECRSRISNVEMERIALA